MQNRAAPWRYMLESEYTCQNHFWFGKFGIWNETGTLCCSLALCKSKGERWSGDRIYVAAAQSTNGASCVRLSGAVSTDEDGLDKGAVMWVHMPLQYTLMP